MSELQLLKTRRGFRATPRRKSLDGNRKVLFVCLDGCNPEYLQKADVPNLERMMRAGFYTEGKAVMPSVTNVNNAGIVTACQPRDHGISGNYYWDRVRRQGTYMETSHFLRAPTIFELARRRGFKTALLCAKRKLISLLRGGVHRVASAEQAPRDLRTVLGPNPQVYSPDLSYWCFRAAQFLLGKKGYNFIYLTTSDYMMHKHAPEDPSVQEYLHVVDRILGEIVDANPNLEVYLTADHGMNLKTRAIDLQRVLTREGIRVKVIPIIKDKYVAHHSNLGGASYLFLEGEADLHRAVEFLSSLPAVESVHTRQEAFTRFFLPPDRIGDLFVLATREWVFGDLDSPEAVVCVRSHGSLHETAVPILCYGIEANPSQYVHNFDITRRFRWVNEELDL